MIFSSRWIFILASLSSIVLSHPGVDVSAKSLIARQSTVDFHNWGNLYGNGPWCFFWCKNSSKTTAIQSAASEHDHEKRSPSPLLSPTSDTQAYIEAQKLNLDHAKKMLAWVKEECGNILSGATWLRVFGKEKEKRDEGDRTVSLESSVTVTATATTTALQSTSDDPPASETDTHTDTDTDLPDSITDPGTNVPTTSSIFTNASNTTVSAATSSMNTVSLTATTSSTKATATNNSTFSKTAVKPSISSSATASPTLTAGGNMLEALTILGGLVFLVMGLML